MECVLGKVVYIGPRIRHQTCHKRTEQAVSNDTCVSTLKEITASAEIQDILLIDMLIDTSTQLKLKTVKERMAFPDLSFEITHFFSKHTGINLLFYQQF